MRHILVVAMFAVLSACAGVQRTPVPVESQAAAKIPNIPDARFWGDEPPPNIDEIVETVYGQRKASGITSVTALALSGGADLGAYGAGILNAWSERGDRPEFTVVTGISTGALSAPFAFLGPDHDEDLKQVYGGYPAHDIIRRRSIWEILPQASAIDTSPLADLIASYVDEEMLEKIAHEHRRGRRLMAQTTYLDAQRPVVWDLGAIAASGAPNALDLFRQVLLASASIPVAFPPALIEVELDGEQYDEMHGDGGLISQLTLLSGWQTKLSTITPEGGAPLEDAYVIVNGKIAPEPQQMPYQIFDLASRTALTMIKVQLIADLDNAYAGMETRGADFHATWIGADFEMPYEGPFNQDFMKALFEYGYNRMLEGDPWSEVPPRQE